MRRREEREREERAARVYSRREEMLAEIVPLDEVGLGCGGLVLRSWEELHVARHAWEHATNPRGYLDPHIWDRHPDGDPA